MNKQLIISFTFLFLVAGCASKSAKTPEAMAISAAEQDKAQDTPENNTFTTFRTFNADINKVYKMWVKPEKFAKWLGPNGAVMTYVSKNVKVGGTSHWKMTTPDGMTKFGKINYQEIKSPSLLVYTQFFCDKDGNPAKLPIPVPYPDVLKTTVNFEKLDGNKTDKNKTNVIVKWEISGDSTPAERKTFRDMKGVMTNGWGQSFSKLDALLK